jgi:hypothetical protein
MPDVSFDVRQPVVLTVDGTQFALPDHSLASYVDQGVWLSKNVPGTSWRYVSSSNLMRVRNTGGGPIIVDCPGLGFVAETVPAGGEVSGSIQPHLPGLSGIRVHCSLFSSLASGTGGVGPSDVAGVILDDVDTRIAWAAPPADLSVLTGAAANPGDVSVRLLAADGSLLVPRLPVTIVLQVDF